MANAIYPKWKEAAMQGLANSALTGSLRVALVDTANYTYSAGHQYLTSVAVVSSSEEILANKTYANGTLDADDVTFATVPAGPAVEAIVMYLWTGAPSTSRLVAYLDTGYTNLPLTPNGGTVAIQWNAAGIFTLGS